MTALTNIRSAQDSFEEYHGDKSYYSSSHFKEIAKSPLQLKYYMEHGKEETPAMKMGTAIHKILLEGPTVFQEEYAFLDPDKLPVPDKDFRTKANKVYRDEFYAECAENDIICLSLEEYARVFDIGDKLYHNKYIRSLLSDGVAELSHYFHDPEYGLDLKLRPDFLPNKKPYYVSVKKTKDASRNGFARECLNYAIHTKEAYYLDYLNKFYEGTREPFQHAIILAVEETPPYHFNIFLCDSDRFIEPGRVFYRAFLWQIQQCVQSGNWPGYEVQADSEVTGLTTLSLPDWIVDKLNITDYFPVDSPISDNADILADVA